MFHCVLNISPIIVPVYLSEYVCFFYHYFHFQSKKFKSSRSQMSFKIDVFKNFAIFTGKHLCWSFFVIKLPAYKPANLLKRDSKTNAMEHLRWLLFKVVWNMSELHHEEQKRLLLSCSGFFTDNLDHVHNWAGCFY